MARIVIVDDDELVCAIVARTLTPLGHVVLPVRDGEEALDSLWDTGPDLVILDCALPGKTGLAILGEMRTSAMFRDLPVLILTARRSEWHVKMALEAGANAYVRKPFAPEELIEKVTALLSRPHATAEATVAPDTLLDCARLADLRGAVGDADANRLLEMMLRDIGARTEAIAGALGEGNFVRAEREAHALRGACNGVGALDLALACLAIERGECRTSGALEGLAIRTMAAIEEARSLAVR
ncbi:response regulator transcription factor [Sphingomonas sp. TREG-RG-20F-R18-01]|uniref:response regulator transcription factor n=1 Tax=Sphingomonas sp. TREG-RG-20F-R18-01 TaxID=2914982 RepID=UPI001F5663FB|nr:response regulator transcription factor [Sphingomonas sp. TREG-RG-20F-R18-01]